VVVVAVIIFILAARPLRPLSSDQPRLIEHLASALDESIEDIRNEEEPRRAVIAAYAKMERILATYGLPRHNFEAPLEYLSRIFQNLGAHAEALRSLTDLFELAKFSHHEVSVAMGESSLSPRHNPR
jgi:hypothetical protein